MRSSLKDKIKRLYRPDSPEKEGQGYNNARGEVPDKKRIPKNNGLNVNNDPERQREKGRLPR